MASETNAATDFVQEQDIIVLAAAAVVVLVLCGVCCCCTGVFSGIARRLGCRKTVRDCCIPRSSVPRLVHSSRFLPLFLN